MNVSPRGRVSSAALFVVDFLAAGPRPSAEVYSAAAKAGIARATLARVARRHGIVMTRSGFPSRSMWSLPDRSETTETTEATKPCGRFDAARDARLGDPAAICQRCGHTREDDTKALISGLGRA